MAQELEANRNQRQHHNGHAGHLDIVLHDVDIAQEVAQRGESGAPQDAAEHVVHNEGAIAHVADAGHDGGKGAHHRNEAGHHDCLRAMVLKKCMCAFDMGGLEQTAFGSGKERRPNLAAKHVAHLIARNRGHHHNAGGHQQRVVERIVDGGRRREETGDEQQRVARQEEADEEAGLGEHDGCEKQQSAVLDP